MPYNVEGEYGTKHTFDTDNPQSYETHKRVAYKGSWLLFKGALAGWIHGTWPEWKRWQFWTSTLIIRLTLQLWQSSRHDKEFVAVFSPEILDKLRIYREK